MRIKSSLQARCSVVLACILTLGGCVKHTSDVQSPLPEDSIYRLDSQWVNQDNKQMRLSELKGRVQILAMVYTSCQYVCPLIVSDMKRIQKALPEKLKGQVGLVLVSFDPERDTPEKLKKYSQDRNLDPAHWTLLHGQPDGILDLAAVLNVKFKKEVGGDFVHSYVISILDPQGVVKHQQIGEGQDPSESARVIMSLKQGIAIRTGPYMTHKKGNRRQLIPKYPKNF